MLKFLYKQVIESITNTMQKIKHFLESEKGKNLLIIFIVILVGLGSFGLGRLSKSQEDRKLEVLYENLPQNTSVTTSNPLNLSQNSPNSLNKANNSSNVENTLKRGYVASKIGSKYYPIDCSAGDKLKESNKIYFSTEKEAIEAGYTKSSSC